MPKNGLMAMAGTMGAPSSAGRGAMQIPPVSVETQMYHGGHMTNWTNQGLRTDTKTLKCVHCKLWKRNGGMEDCTQQFPLRPLEGVIFVFHQPL